MDWPELWRTPAVVALAGMLGGCYSGGPNERTSAGEDGPLGTADTDGREPGIPLRQGTCVDTHGFFKEQVWNPILSKTCIACHNSEGAAKATDFVLQFPDYPDYLAVNYETLEQLSRLEIDGVPLLLRKPTMDGVDHGGKLQLDPDSEEYESLAEMIERFAEPVHCYDPDKYRDFYRPLVLLDETQTLRKAALTLAGRLPTPDELDEVGGAGIDALDPVLDGLMQEDAFFTRLRDFYGDRLQTDLFLPTTSAINLLDPVRFPTSRFFENIPPEDPERIRQRDLANGAIAREPLHLIEWVARQGRPFGEILTADYRVVTPFSARSYDVPLESFVDPDDPDEWIEVRFDDLPQSGLLTTPSWLARFPTTPTNRNRHRARMVYEMFFATDIMSLAGRAIDVAAIEDDNPTLFNSKCTVCHDNIDAWAGAFRGWSGVGRYFEQNWYTDMVPTSFRGEELPADEKDHAVGWLARHIVDDPKFAMSVVHTLYMGITGQEPLRQPLDASADDYGAKVLAFEAQEYAFMQMAERFQNADQDVRVLVRELVKSPWFRSTSTTEPLTAEQARQLQSVGTARLLTPELLHDKIVATTGYRWRDEAGSDVLLDSNGFRLLYGGLDASLRITDRVTTLNGVMANVAERMANEVSCTVTALDFSKARSERLLFPHVELSDTPDDAGPAIADNIRYLHGHLLGEELEADDPELARAFAVFEAVWSDGIRGLQTGEYPAALPDPCRSSALGDDPDYTVRAWMAVMSYLLADFRFLYE